MMYPSNHQYTRYKDTHNYAVMYNLLIDKAFDALDNLVAISMIDLSLSNAFSVTSYAFLGM